MLAREDKHLYPLDGHFSSHETNDHWFESNHDSVGLVPIEMAHDLAHVRLRDNAFQGRTEGGSRTQAKNIDIRCPFNYQHNIMARTTVNIDDPLLKELKSLQRKEKQSLGKLMSQLLAEAISRRKKTPPASRLHWVARPMEARIDITDKETLFNILDETSK